MTAFPLATPPNGDWTGLVAALKAADPDHGDALYHARILFALCATLAVQKAAGGETPTWTKRWLFSLTRELKWGSPPGENDDIELILLDVRAGASYLPIEFAYGGAGAKPRVTVSYSIDPRQLKPTIQLLLPDGIKPAEVVAGLLEALRTSVVKGPGFSIATEVYLLFATHHAEIAKILA